MKKQPGDPDILKMPDPLSKKEEFLQRAQKFIDEAGLGERLKIHITEDGKVAFR